MIDGRPSAAPPVSGVGEGIAAFLGAVWEFLARAFDWALTAVVEFAMEEKFAAAALLFAFVRLWGRTVQSGERGVLFVLGRALGEVEPGFHYQIPLVRQVRRVRVRSRTMEFPVQRVLTAEGFVFLVDASLVYQVRSARDAIIEVDDFRAGLKNVVPTAVQEVVATSTRGDLRAGGALGERLAAAIQAKVERWGIEVEQAGFNSVTPSPATLRLTQLEQVAGERRRRYEALLANGLDGASALALLGSRRQLVGRARARYRGQRRGAAAAEPGAGAKPKAEAGGGSKAAEVDDDD